MFVAASYWVIASRPSVVTFVRLSVCPSVRLSVCLSVRLSVRLSCPSPHLFVCPSAEDDVDDGGEVVCDGRDGGDAVVRRHDGGRLRSAPLPRLRDALHGRGRGGPQQHRLRGRHAGGKRRRGDVLVSNSMSLPMGEGRGGGRGVEGREGREGRGGRDRGQEGRGWGEGVVGRGGGRADCLLILPLTSSPCTCTMTAICPLLRLSLPTVSSLMTHVSPLTSAVATRTSSRRCSTSSTTRRTGRWSTTSLRHSAVSSRPTSPASPSPRWVITLSFTVTLLHCHTVLHWPYHHTVLD